MQGLWLQRLVLLTIAGISPDGVAEPSVPSPPGVTASPSPSADFPEAGRNLHSETTTVDPSEIERFAEAPQPVQALLTEALELAGQKLDYRYGSNDPANGGMDCSGFVHYLLSRHGYPAVPRQSDAQYRWLRKAGRFFAVLSSNAQTFELEDLKPGDLLFWTDLTNVEREIPVTHVMLYLGTAKEDGRRLMIGASDGRTFKGRPMRGVSVFDFRLPRRSPVAGQTSHFVGYGTPPSS